jgi:hypothetical protein
MAYQFVRASSQSLQASSAPAQGMPMTLAAWVYPVAANIGGQVALCVSETIPTNGHRHVIGISGANLWRAATRGVVSGTSTTVNALGNSATANEWTHLAGVFTSSSSRSVYANGALQGTATTTISSINSFTRATIAADIDGGAIGTYWGGSIAEVGVWNVALTADEVSSLGRGVTCDQVRPQSLVFYAPLIRNIADMARGVTLTNVNTATVSDHPRVYA